MKRLWITIVVASLMIFGAAWGQQATIYDDRPKISANGEAVVNVKPDKIVINFGIETWDTDIVIAKQKNNNILKKAVAAMKESSIPQRDIQTDYLSIEPRWKSECRRVQEIP